MAQPKSDPTSSNVLQVRQPIHPTVQHLMDWSHRIGLSLEQSQHWIGLADNDLWNTPVPGDTSPTDYQLRLREIDDWMRILWMEKSGLIQKGGEVEDFRAQCQGVFTPEADAAVLNLACKLLNNVHVLTIQADALMAVFLEHRNELHDLLEIATSASIASVDRQTSQLRNRAAQAMFQRVVRSASVIPQEVKQGNAKYLNQWHQWRNRKP